MFGPGDTAMSKDTVLGHFLCAELSGFRFFVQAVPSAHKTVPLPLLSLALMDHSSLGSHVPSSRKFSLSFLPSPEQAHLPGSTNKALNNPLCLSPLHHYGHPGSVSLLDSVKAGPSDLG